MVVERYAAEVLERLPSGTQAVVNDKQIQASALSDPDNLPMNGQELAAMRPASDVLPWLVQANKERRGRV